MRRFFAGLGMVAAVTVWIGCDVATGTLDSYPPATLKTAEDLDYWSSASAPNVYMAGLTPLIIAQFATEFSDAGCPSKTTSGAVETYQGGCTANGTTWIGSMTSEGADAGTGSIHYNGFGMEQTKPCISGTYVARSTFNGSFTQSTPSSGDSTFKVDLLMEGSGTDGGSCDLLTASAAWNYNGTTNNTTGLWTGKGRVGNSDRGVVSADTASEKIDSAVCSSEAASGTTTLQAGTDVAVITYDGAQKCDSAGTVTWTLNGTAKGEVSGISCSAAAGAASLPALALLVAGAVLLRSRASRRSQAR